VSDDNWKIIKDRYQKQEKEFFIEAEKWVTILNNLAAAYHHWKGEKRRLMVRLMTPLYYARIASYVNYRKDISTDESEKQRTW